VQWARTTAVESAPDGVTLVGEGIAGTGLANIIGHSLTQGESLLAGLSE
jgi:hypothetical protein